MPGSPSARGIDHTRAAAILDAVEAELDAAGIERGSAEWRLELERRISERR